MPNYTYKNTLTQEEYTVSSTIAERDLYLEENPHIEQLILFAPAYISEVYSHNKAPKDFRNYLKRMKKGNRKSNIDSGNITEL